MSRIPLPRDLHDLNYGRPERLIGIEMVRDADGKEYQVSKSGLLNTRNRRLNKLSRDLRSILRQKDALAFCLHLMGCELGLSVHGSANVDTPRVLVKSLPSRPDGDNEEDVLQTRLNKTPYISMTESPWRVLRFAQYMPSAEVFLIDFDRLRATQIRIESTTQIANQLDVQYKGPGDNRINFITGSHWVAQHWIPADCIIKKIPLCQFEKVCHDKGIYRCIEPLQILSVLTQ